MPICDNLTDKEEEMTLSKQIEETERRGELREGMRYCENGIDYELTKIKKSDTYPDLFSVGLVSSFKERADGNYSRTLQIIGPFTFAQHTQKHKTYYKKTDKRKENLDDQFPDSYRTKDGTPLSDADKELMRDTMERARMYEID